MQTCSACSTSCPENSGRFCPECGAVLAAMAATNPGSQVAEPAASSPIPDDRPASSSAEAKERAAASLVGTKVDGFTIEGVVGGGSFGSVYRARQLGLDRIVAFKVPTMEIASDPIMAKRFAREAKAAARIDHPGVVAIYAVGELSDGRPYLAMQLLEGEPLDRILATGPIACDRALGIARQIASALSETHAADVVHRDLKPTNIMWRRDRAGDDRITLVDFGIAVCKPGNADATRLTAGGLIGTPHYMSPEQAHGEQVDARADIYALGCLVFELITNTTPFEGSGFEVLLAHLGRAAPRPSERNPAIPEAVDDLVLAMMAKKPDNRVQTADEVIEMIDDILERIESLPPATPQTPRPKRKTGSTRKDRPAIHRPAVADSDSFLEPLPDPPAPPRTSRVRWMALGALLAIAVCAGVYVALPLDGTSNAASRSDDTDTTTPLQRHEIFRDDGETRLRVWVPEPFVVGRSRLWIELRNKLGAPIAGDQLIVTIEDPDQRAIGITARPRQDNPDQFGFAHEYKVPGTYHLHVFPSEVPSTFDVELDVRPR